MLIIKTINIMAKILLLGAGELGKEFVIAAQRLGQYVIAVDSYKNAPAMQVSDEFEVINMLDGAALDAIVLNHKPDYIVPEIEASGPSSATLLAECGGCGAAGSSSASVYLKSIRPSPSISAASSIPVKSASSPSMK